MTPPVNQTLSSGQSVEQQYGNFGAVGTFGDAPLERMLSVILGMKGIGKTSLFLQYPGALIINMDCSGTPRNEFSKAPKSQTWPIKDSATGKMIGADGGVMQLTWARVEELKTILLEAADKDLPRPNLIVMDSIPAALRLAKDYVIDEANKLGITKKESVNNWRLLDGRAAYDVLYDLLVNFTLDLRNIGNYGVVWPIHLNRVRTQKQFGGETVMVEQVDLAVTEAFFNRIRPFAELICVLERKTITETKVRKITIPDPIKGGTKVIERPESVSHEVRSIRFKGNSASSDPYEEMLSARVPLPDSVVLSPDNPWNDFYSAYKQAAALIN